MELPIFQHLELTRACPASRSDSGILLPWLQKHTHHRPTYVKHHITRFEKRDIRINRQRSVFKKLEKVFCLVNSAYINSPGLIYCQLIWIIALFVQRCVVLDYSMFIQMTINSRYKETPEVHTLNKSYIFPKQCIR